MFCDEVVSLHNDIRNMFSRMHPPLPPAPEAEKIMSALGDHATATLDDEDGTGRNGIELGVSAAAEATTTPMAGGKAYLVIVEKAAGLRAADFGISGKSDP